MTDYCSFISMLDTYFKIHPSEGNYEFVNVGVGWETASGLSEPASPFYRPCVGGRIDKIIERVKADWAFVMYGVNDGIYYPPSKERNEAYYAGITGIVNKLHDSGAKVALMTPPPFDTMSYNGKLYQGEKEYDFAHAYIYYNDTLDGFAKWIKNSGIADKVIDTRQAMAEWEWSARTSEPYYKSGDGIHCNIEGNFVIAKTILEEFFGQKLNKSDKFSLRNLYKLVAQRQGHYHKYLKETIGHDSIEKDIFLPLDQLTPVLDKLDGKIQKMTAKSKYCEHVSSYHGFKRYDFDFAKHNVIVVEPKIPSKKWMWRTEFFGTFDEVDLAMLDRGYYLIFYSIPDLFGAPKALELMNNFHTFITAKLNLDKQAKFIGHSRGGLYAIHFAGRYPDKIGGMFLDVPVVDIRSWPAKISEYDWKPCKKLYGLTDDTTDRYSVILKKTLASLVSNKIPLVLVSADSDKTVPYEENSALLVEAYQNSPAKDCFQHIMQKGDHHSHISQNVEAQVEFLTNIKDRN